MNDPTSMSPGSIMPPYPWLLTNDLDISTTSAKIDALRKLGVPYPLGYDARANEDLRAQAEAIATDLHNNNVPADPGKEIIALIAYLQRLGTDINVQRPQ